ncbi:type II toxin-antitoxin system HicB family antitoxin [Azospirillum sp. SYSU D00513]|uniref:type II toxin-antitoxin system HicB family antitoxin n=1 Tax=Azospirillum sp. SYSU D00513 TaxID=2812561 RepID=UPI001A95BD1D|nr:type II toxin-antitoxin system HicB family antitoxin [Azospirillum sp. SYSU D00513]
MDASEYPVIVRPMAPEAGTGYVAEVPDLPGCVSSGATPAEANENVLAAIQTLIDAARAAGTRMPEPSRRLRMVDE